MMTLLFGIKDVIWRSFCFQKKDTITLRQAFISIYILCKSENILVTENIKDFRRNFKTSKFTVLPWQQLPPDTPKVSSRSSWDKHILKIW